MNHMERVFLYQKEEGGKAIIKIHDIGKNRRGLMSVFHSNFRDDEKLRLKKKIFSFFLSPCVKISNKKLMILSAREETRSVRLVMAVESVGNVYYKLPASNLPVMPKGL